MPARLVIPVPDGVNLRDAACAPIAFSTVEHMLFDSAASPHNGMLKPDASAPGFGLTFKRPARQGTLSAP